MGCLQLCVLLWLITGLAALPICNFHDAEQQRICEVYKDRWYDLQKEIQSKECPSVDPEDPDCLQKANKKTTEMLSSEVKNMPVSNKTICFKIGALNVEANRNEGGTPIERQHTNNKGFFQSLWDAISIW